MLAGVRLDAGPERRDADPVRARRTGGCCVIARTRCCAASKRGEKGEVTVNGFVIGQCYSEASITGHDPSGKRLRHLKSKGKLQNHTLVYEEMFFHLLRIICLICDGSAKF